jgi:hypothetical protein
MRSSTAAVSMMRRRDSSVRSSGLSTNKNECSRALISPEVTHPNSASSPKTTLPETLQETDKYSTSRPTINNILINPYRPKQYYANRSGNLTTNAADFALENPNSASSPERTTLPETLQETDKYSTS